MTALEFNFALTESTRDLRPFALRLTRDRDDAADLLQDTALKAFVHKEKFEKGTNLKAWMYTIMKNTFITNYQRIQRRNTILDSTDNQYYLNSLNHSTFNYGDELMALEDMDRAIQSLESAFRDPFLMYFHGYKYHEIADRLSVPIGTVKNRIHLARKELKSLLRSYVG